MPNYTRSWNASYEASPPTSGESASLGAERIRNLKIDLRERMITDHQWNDGLTTNSEDGEHSKVTLEQRAAPANLADRAILYGFDIDTGAGLLTELYVRDESGNQIRLTERGVIALLRGRNSWDRAQQTPEIALTDAATIAIDAALSNAFRVTLGGNRTLGVPTNPVAGQVISIRFIQDGTGSRTLTVAGQGFLGSSTDDLTLSTAASAQDLMTLYRGNVSWHILGLKKGIHTAL